MKNMIDIWRSETLNPWKEFASLQRQMGRLFDGFSRNESNQQFMKSIDFVPACDVEETENRFLVSLDIPGMKKDQLNVEITGHTLTISGEQKEEKTEGKGAQRTCERYHGRFERSFTLPQIAASDKVEADYRDGVLRISVPKCEEAKAKTRKIQIGESMNPLFGKPATRSEEKKEQKTAGKAA